MTSHPLDPTLAALAQAYGVTTEYISWTGEPTAVREETVRSVLASLDVEVSTPYAAQLALDEAHLRAWRRTLPPTVVMRERWTPWVPVHVPHGTHVWLEILLEEGASWHANQVEHWVEPREVDGVLVGEATFELPGTVPLGWHTLVAHVDGQPDATATLIVTPASLSTPDSVAGERIWGLMHQVYQGRSARSWGLGDLADLTELAAWGGRDLGADFILVNPLHAAEPTVPVEPSPYLPTTRRFVNPLYLRVEEIPEVAYLRRPERDRVDALAAQAHVLNRSETLDRDAVWELKERALRVIYGAGRSGRRQRAFEDYCQREGEGLTDFATWCALVSEHGHDWHDWPLELRDAHGHAVAAYREGHVDEVDFYRWLQWQLEEQLSSAQRVALGAGMSLGVVHDLAVGVHPHGAEAWWLADALASGVTVGAPPDQYTQLGQDWSQPPWRPDRLAELGYRPYRDMLRTVLRDSGGIRVDHVIGLFRLWWVPEGMTPDRGTYVSYDHEALIGILVLEAQRAGAVVIGEDLGTVPPMARDYLRERGILGTSIMWFESEGGAPLPPERYRELAMTTVTTHDLPPTAGYLTLRHVDVRAELGLLTRDVEDVREREEAELAKVRAVLVERGLVAVDADVDGLVLACHRLIAQTPSRMLGVAVPDLVGDRRPVNQPGTDEEYPNWRVPLTDETGRLVTVEDVQASGLAQQIARVMGDATR